MNVPEISVSDMKRLREERADFVLLDVREPDELATVRVDFAMHVPMGDVAARIGELPQGKQIVVMCHHGGRSARVTKFLRDRGFDRAVNLDGGIDAWALEIDPTLARY